MSEQQEPEPLDADRGDERPSPSFSQSFGEAMRRTGLGQVRPGEVPTGRSLLAAIGGVRGLIESIVPGLGFLVIYSLTKSLPLSVLIPLALALLFVVVRLVTRTPITQAFAGIAGIAISAVLALITGKPEDNFLPGIVINLVSLAVLLLSVVVRWPLIGIVVGFLTNEGTQWRQDRAKRRVLYLATWLWCGLFALRLVVEVPLYLSHRAEWLAGTKLLLGVPLYAAMLWVTWLLVRAVYGRLDGERAA
ncbi:MAG TPA: DUF3159 domain-containing protein [Lacisediminihabitans sp.]|uniref:DUF3159 domain-containing protein n=1 Tax=Lacisediminihabitans sp. TaxID=2787631 RepID=UPI002EDB2AB9